MSAEPDVESDRSKDGATAAEQHVHLATCWACSTRVQLPVVEGAPSQTFQVYFRIQFSTVRSVFPFDLKTKEVSLSWTVRTLWRGDRATGSAACKGALTEPHATVRTHEGPIRRKYACVE